MTKVEELRSKLQSLIGDVVRQLHVDAYGDFDATIPPVIDSLISAARSEGVAEGAEEMRMKILDTGRFLLKNENVEDGFELRDGDEEYGSYIIVPTDNYRLLREADIPEKSPSVLAPTKEGEK